MVGIHGKLQGNHSLLLTTQQQFGVVSALLNDTTKVDLKEEESMSSLVIQIF